MIRAYQCPQCGSDDTLCLAEAVTKAEYKIPTLHSFFLMHKLHWARCLSCGWAGKLAGTGDMLAKGRIDDIAISREIAFTRRLAQTEAELDSAYDYIVELKRTIKRVLRIPTLRSE